MIKIATENDLNNIASLHIKCFQNYFLTKLGFNLLVNYYKEFIKKEDIFLISVDNRGGNQWIFGRHGIVREWKKQFY
jgi:hypothetical protein